MFKTLQIQLHNTLPSLCGMWWQCVTLEEVAKKNTWDYEKWGWRRGPLKNQNVKEKFFVHYTTTVSVDLRVSHISDILCSGQAAPQLSALQMIIWPLVGACLFTLHFLESDWIWESYWPTVSVDLRVSRRCQLSALQMIIWPLDGANMADS